jgi:methylenetetrahydrofolate dehydrogenase (NADP+)/methenyltetrahydrofolate cyclohydrolase
VTPIPEPTRIIDGRAHAARLTEQVRAEVSALRAATGRVPGLAVVLVGDDPASVVYVAAKHRQCMAAGLASFEYRLPAHTPVGGLLSLIDRLNGDPDVHGILVQLPLPPAIDPTVVIGAIAPGKDVDGFHVINAGRLATGQSAMVPCTPLGCLLLLQDSIGDLSGRHAVVVGRSTIVGRPMAQLLLGANCTVTVAHSRTRDLPGLCRTADILVAAIGQPEMIRGAWVRRGAVVIDVGINRVERDGRSRLVGDVAFDEAYGHVGAITPVPGGVGPMTIACLLANTLAAFRQTLTASSA